MPNNTGIFTYIANFIRKPAENATEILTKPAKNAILTEEVSNATSSILGKSAVSWFDPFGIFSVTITQTYGGMFLLLGGLTLVGTMVALAKSESLTTKIKNFFSFKDDVMVDVTNGLLEAFNGSENKEGFVAKLNENTTIRKALAKAKSSDGKRFDEEIESLFGALSKAKKGKTPVTIESLEPSALETIKAFIFGLLKYITVLPAIAEYMGKGESYLQSTRAIKVDAKERLTSFKDFVQASNSPAAALARAA